MMHCYTYQLQKYLGILLRIQNRKMILWWGKRVNDFLIANIMSFYSKMPDCNTKTFIWTKNFLCHVQ